MDIFEIIKKRIILTLQTQSFQFIDYSLTKVLNANLKLATISKA